MLIKHVSIVFANYCPHCVPFSLRNAIKMAEDLHVPLKMFDIEVPEQLEAADRLVEEHGDWSEDYLIPQLFVEYAEGRVDHVLTGFSEAISVTEASWKALFSSSYYQSLVSGSPAASPRQALLHHTSLRKFVQKYLTFQGICYRHCEKPSFFVDLQPRSIDVFGAYVCPDRYVSRVVYFSPHADANPLKSFLDSQVGEEIVTDRDIRPATRHGWELGGEAFAEIGEASATGNIKEFYWTIYPKTEEEKRRGIFLCSFPEKGRGCGRLFVQETKSRDRLCPECRL